MGNDFKAIPFVTVNDLDSDGFDESGSQVHRLPRLHESGDGKIFLMDTALGHGIYGNKLDHTTKQGLGTFLGPCTLPTLLWASAWVTKVFC